LFHSFKFGGAKFGGAGFPRGIETMEKALNFKINFQDLVFEFGQNVY